jgi:hemerythrin superfamily protein
MPRTTIRKPSEPSKRAPAKQNALGLLKADHAEVKGLFKEFERLKKADDAEGKERIVHAACRALAIHAQLEEEIFYPALRNAGVSDDSLDEADVEHSHIKELVEELEDADSGEALFDARVKVLSEYVEHHVKEEESTLFSAARKTRIDLASMGEELEAKKTALGGRQEPIDVAQLASARRADSGKPTHRSK